jgi:hypothetical protein
MTNYSAQINSSEGNVTSLSATTLPSVPLDNIFNLAYVGNMYFGSTM